MYIGKSNGMELYLYWFGVILALTSVMEFVSMHSLDQQTWKCKIILYRITFVQSWHVALTEIWKSNKHEH